MKNKFLKTKKDIIEWLNRHQINKYKLMPDPQYKWVVDVDSEVELRNKNLTFIPVKFNIVKGHFRCDNNALTSLIFCPHTVEGNFSCSLNQLTSLKGAPINVSETFFAHKNRLISLKGAPKKLKGGFVCDDNQLTSLRHSPVEVLTFQCDNNKITSLRFCTKIINYDFNCRHNQLTSLQYLPKYSIHIKLTGNPLLGEFEKIKNFKILRQEHLRINKILRLNKKLSVSLILNECSDKIQKI